MNSEKKMNVAILGATGTVGQKFITLLQDHPWFEITELVASKRSAGKSYREACSWKQNSPLNSSIANIEVKDLNAALNSPILFSGLDSDVAGEAELSYAEQGHVVISNSKNHRMDEHVPLVIPEINPEHFSMIASQETSGAIITNSNCSTMFLAMCLAPLYETFGLKAVHVSTMQAISGAGYPGVASYDILGNIVPYIGGEEDKLETEPQKIMGTLGHDGLSFADFAVSAQCNRVPVVDGHMETLSVSLERDAELEELRRVLQGFRGLPQELKLPSAPEHPILLMEEADRPQPARDVWLEGGMSTLVGRLRPCSVFDYKMVIMGHNTVRGAAGAAILNAEAMLRLGLFGDRPGERFSPERLKRRAAALSGKPWREAVLSV